MGKEFTVTAFVAVFTQPLISVPVTEYVVVVIGDLVIADVTSLVPHK